MKVPSTGHLRYDWFKHNLKSNNFINSMLEALFDNVEGTILSSLINVCYYFVECYKDEFISAGGGCGLTFSGQIFTIETASMMDDVGVNISQFHILLRILRYKIGPKLFEPETKITDLCGKIIVP